MGEGVERIVAQTREAIDDNRVEELGRLLKAHPELLRWRDPQSGEVLLQATTSYANFPGAENEEHWNRPACAELLLDAGAERDPRVPLRILQTGAHRMLELFHARGEVPSNLRSFAALGRLDEVRGCFDATGALRDHARPAPELRRGYAGAKTHWPEPDDDDMVLGDAVLFACRFGREEVVRELVERTCEIDTDLAQRIEGWEGRAAFVAYLLERAPEGARFGMTDERYQDTPAWLWQCACELRLHEALHAKDVERVRELVTEQAFLLSEPALAVQVRFLEVAAYTPDTLPLLRVFFEAGPALLSVSEPPPSSAISYALEYGYAPYLELLERVWSVPDDLPHAAGRGDRAAVERWLGADPSSAPTEQDILDRALAWAVQNAEYGIADLLLERGADIDTRWGTHEPASLLHECAFAGRMEQVKYLVGKGIDLTRTDHRFGSTASGWAEFAGHAEIAAFLAERGG